MNRPVRKKKLEERVLSSATVSSGSKSAPRKRSRSPSPLSTLNQKRPRLEDPPLVITGAIGCQQQTANLNPLSSIPFVEDGVSLFPSVGPSAPPSASFDDRMDVEVVPYSLPADADVLRAAQEEGMLEELAEFSARLVKEENSDAVRKGLYPLKIDNEALSTVLRILVAQLCRRV